MMPPMPAGPEMMPEDMAAELAQAEVSNKQVQ
jgi:hypothetical protein